MLSEAHFVSVRWFYRLISAPKLKHQIHRDINSQELHDATSVTDTKPVGEVNTIGPRPVRILQHCSATLKVLSILTSSTLQAGTCGGLKNYPGTKFRPQFLRWERVKFPWSPSKFLAVGRRLIICKSCCCKSSANPGT